jgi:glycosyltransferase involved in cell wall biosynthesis
LKIVLFADSLHSIAAGSERQIFKLAEGLVASGHDVRLFLLRHTAFTQSDAFSFPCPTSVLNITSLLSWSAVTTMRRFSKELQKENVAVVHAYFPDACLLAPLFLKSSKRRIITSRRDMGLIYKGKPAWIFRILGFRTDLVISNSSAVAKFISQKEGLKETKTHVIYNGIENFLGQGDTQKGIFKNADSIKLILVANVKPVKRTLDAVIALDRLVRDGHTVELALAGEKQDKNYVAEINAFIEKNSLTQSVHWLGQVSEPRRILKQADIGLLISESEGLSNTIMEYMQAGLPIIATDVGGNPELVTHDHNGVLIPKGDTVSLANAILRLSSDSELVKNFGRNGQLRIAQQFSVDAMIEQHEIAYSK